MRSKAAPYILLIVLAVITFILMKRKEDRSPGAAINRDHGFDRRISLIEYTKHAKCRMQCRHISQDEVQEMMRDGKINYHKSDVNDKPCPTYTLEGVTKDDQRVRIVFAQCDRKSKIVTVIDLDKEWQCDCPGDNSGSTSSPPAGSHSKNRN